MVEENNNYEADNDTVSSDTSNFDDTNDFLESAEQSLQTENLLQETFSENKSNNEFISPSNESSFKKIFDLLKKSLVEKHQHLKDKIKETYDKKVELRQKKFNEDVQKIDSEFKNIEFEFNNIYNDLVVELEDIYSKYKNKDHEDILQNNNSLENYKNTKINSLKDNLNLIVNNLDFDTTW